ncbi:histidine kinase-like ATPase, partial [Diaporthe sp. PMI_573]
MPISALPESTVRLLGSAAAISSPVDVIKELLDNALDAEATSVEILVSPNLIDRIQVRDNGHGIQAYDYNSLGCVGHTSKLTSFEELQTFGGKSLGFRGQALASANSLGRITVVTRCVGDSTAVKLTLCADVGGIESQQRVSAPVGTTVTVIGLFKFIPVREQVAEKESQKNLAKVKHLFHAYALARPMIRLSLKVLGGDIRQNWSYSPRPGASVRDAVVQVFGTGVMADCVLKKNTSKEDSLTGENAHGGSQITIEAVLPRPDADWSKLSKGSFFSVDTRPVSTSRGTMKKLMSILKVHFKKSLGVDAEDRRLSDLFTCINVTCSPGTYDPNLEPSKNQVLFVDESQLVELFEGLCSNTY